MVDSDRKLCRNCGNFCNRGLVKDKKSRLPDLNISSSDLIYINKQYYLSDSFMSQVVTNYVYYFMAGMIFGVGLTLLLKEAIIPFVKSKLLNSWFLDNFRLSQIKEGGSLENILKNYFSHSTLWFFCLLDITKYMEPIQT